MRKTAFGPLRCDTCGYVLGEIDLRLVAQALRGQTVHLRCLSVAELREALVRIAGVRCLFCRGSFPIRELIDHFGEQHGKVLVNW